MSKFKKSANDNAALALAITAINTKAVLAVVNNQAKSCSALLTGGL